MCAPVVCKYGLICGNSKIPASFNHCNGHSFTFISKGNQQQRVDGYILKIVGQFISRNSIPYPKPGYAFNIFISIKIKLLKVNTVFENSVWTAGPGGFQDELLTRPVHPIKSGRGCTG